MAGSEVTDVASHCRAALDDASLLSDDTDERFLMMTSALLRMEVRARLY